MVDDHIVEIDKIKVHYRTLGRANKQAVVFIHGWGGLYKNRDQVTKALCQQGFRVFTIEVPGLDRSSTPKEPWDNNQYATYYKKVIDKLGIKKPIVIGQSFGGGVAASYANLFPEQIKYLVLVNANTTDKSYLYITLIKLLGNIFTSMLRSNFVPKSIKTIFIKRMLTVPNETLNGNTFSERTLMGQTFILTHSENQHKKLESIFTQTVLVWGESDRMIPVREAKIMHKKLASSTLVTLPGGHTVIYKDPEAVAKIIKRETDRLDKLENFITDF